MNKQEFLQRLRDDLSGLPSSELEERLSFYAEMIDDRVEDGISEEEAVADIGSLKEISSQILSDIPLSRIAKETIKPKRRLKAWEILLLALGSPIWLSLAVAAFAVILSVYAVLWSLIISVWAVFAALAASAVGVTIAGIGLALNVNTLIGLAMTGAGLFCGGLSVFMFFASAMATKGIIILTKKVALYIKRLFI